MKEKIVKHKIVMRHVLSCSARLNVDFIVGYLYCRWAQPIQCSGQEKVLERRNQKIEKLKFFTPESCNYGNVEYTVNRLEKMKEVREEYSKAVKTISRLEQDIKKYFRNSQNAIDVTAPVDPENFVFILANFRLLKQLARGSELEI